MQSLRALLSTASALPSLLAGVVYETQIHDGAGRPHLALLPSGMSLFGLALQPVVLDLLGACDLFGVMEAFEVVLFSTDAVGGCVGGGVALLEFLPEGEASRSAAFEAESGLVGSASERVDGEGRGGGWWIVE